MRDDDATAPAPAISLAAVSTSYRAGYRTEASARRGSGADDALGHVPEQKARRGAVAVGAHDDEIGHVVVWTCGAAAPQFACPPPRPPMTAKSGDPAHAPGAGFAPSSIVSRRAAGALRAGTSTVTSSTPFWKLALAVSGFAPSGNAMLR